MSLLALLVTGLLGSAHCAGMCGGFALALGAMPGARPHALRFAAYGVGKTTAYAALGALAGSVGYGLWMAVPLQRVLALAFGLVLVVSGGVLWRGFSPNGRWTREVAERLSRPMGRLIGRHTLGAAAGLGVLNGLVPCGLVWAMLAVAAANGSPLGGALVMAAFGVATLPALGLAAAVGARFAPTWRLRIQRAGAALVVFVGLMTVVRATPAGAAVAHALHASPRWGHLAPIADAFCATPAP